MIQKTKRSLLRHLRSRGYQLSRIPRWHTPHDLVDGADHDRVLKIIRRVSAEHNTANQWTGAAYAQRGRAAFYYHLLAHWCEQTGDFPTDAKVLDVGAFHGYFLRLVHRRFPSVSLFGTEIHDACIPIASEVCPAATVMLGNVEAGRADGPYDRICLTEVLEHLEQPAQMAHTLVDLLVSNGSAVFTVPNGRYDTMTCGRRYPEHGSYSGHINFWSLESWTLFWEREFPDEQTRCQELSSGHLVATLVKR